MIYWFTGQPASGKTVLAKALKEHLERKNGNKVFHIDGDELRTLFVNQIFGRAGRVVIINRAHDFD